MAKPQGIGWCNNCCYYNRQDKDSGQCLISEPIAAVNGKSAYWPIVPQGAWCGEWKQG